MGMGACVHAHLLPIPMTFNIICQRLCVMMVLLYLVASLVFNENGRYNENGTWTKMMYGSFAGPR